MTEQIIHKYSYTTHPKFPCGKKIDSFADKSSYHWKEVTCVPCIINKVRHLDPQLIRAIDDYYFKHQKFPISCRCKNCKFFNSILHKDICTHEVIDGFGEDYFNVMVPEDFYCKFWEESKKEGTK